MKYLKPISFIAIAAISFYLGMQAVPQNITEQEQSQAKVEKIDSRETVITERENGEKVTKIIERGVISQIESKSKTKIVKSNPKNWIIDFKASSSFITGASVKPIYTLGVSRRILSSAFLGLYARSDHEYGVSLSFEF